MEDLDSLLYLPPRPIKSCIDRCCVLYCYKTVVHGKETVVTRWSTPKYKDESWQEFYDRIAYQKERAKVLAEARRRELV